MEKALKLGKTSAVGSFQLFIGKSLSTVIMAIGSIILGRLMLPGEYGLYSIALVPSTTMVLFSDWGMDRAITKYIAHNKSLNKIDEINDVLYVGLIFKVIIGLFLSIVSFVLSNFIAIQFLGRPEITPLISLASLTIFSQSLMAASQSSFVGFERMNLNSVTMVCQSVLKSVIGPLLVFLGYGAMGAVVGYTISFVVAAFLSLVLFYFFLFKAVKKSQHTRSEKIKTLKEMLRYGVPVSISTIMSGLRQQLYAFLMAFYCTDIMIGNYQVAGNFAMFLTFFTFPIITVLFPAFSKLDPKNEPVLLKRVFTSSVKYTSIFLVPATIAVMIMSKPMVSTVFGQQYVYASMFLTLYVIVNLLSGFGNLSLDGFLNGLGETRAIMKLSILTTIIGVILAFLLIPPLGITGVIITPLLAGIPGLFFALNLIWKKYDATVDWKSSAKIFFASLIAAVPTWAIITFFNFADWLKLILGVIVFLATYIVVAPSIKAIVLDDIKNLRTMFSSIRLISDLLDLLFSIEEKIANFFSKK